ncbi:MAG: glutamine-hydrolyzing GMP synthase [Eubacteriaceae bacterium]|jgi:GMP synthase (glutamine-hydrolysing)|nr:glutamine-hydrolyzing GMP synthase [Eubacteriaceae bacterium]
MQNFSGTIDEFIKQACESIKTEADGKPALCAVSGGVDSAVCAVLANIALGDSLTCLFVDTGLMRKNEGDQVCEMFESAFSINLVRIDAEDRFLARLQGVTDPEEKRKAIGEEFIRVFEEEAAKLGEIGCLVQGTIYPDIMESGEDGHKQVKAHHNVGGMPTNIEFHAVIEPIKLLYKEEVRECARKLGLPDSFANRQPFPGPGLAVRCLGEVTKQKLALLREADAIFTEELEKAGLNDEVAQYFAIIPGLQTVGVRSDERSYEDMIALRAITSTDFVTAGSARLPYELIETVADRITSEVCGINRVVLDITPKPPGTVEWE